MQTVANSVFRVYIIVFYAIPFVLFIFLGWHKNFVELDHVQLLGGGLFTFLALLFVVFSSRTKRKIKIPLKVRFHSFLAKSSIFAFSIGLLITAILMNQKFGTSFRHTGPNLSEAGIIAQMFTVLKSLCASIMIFYIRAIYYGFKVGFMHRLICFTLMLAYAVFPIAAFDVIFMVFFAGVFLLGSAFRVLLVMKNRYLMMLGFPLVFLVVAMGISTKVGFDGLYAYIWQDGSSRILSYMQYRQGIYFFSSVINYSTLSVITEYWFMGWEVVLDSINYRASVILGDPLQRPEITNLNVLNFSQIYAEYAGKVDVGASPGLLSAFMYIFPFPVNLVFLGLFVHVVCLCINTAFRHKSHLGIVFFILMCFFGVLNNPIHVFSSVGPDMVKVFSLFASLLIGIKGCSKRPIANLSSEKT